MTKPIDLNRARELVEMMDRCNCQGINQHEAASLLRSLCERIEQLEAALAAAGKGKA